MLKGILRRSLSMFLIVVLLSGLIPAFELPVAKAAYAASIDVGNSNLGVSYSGDVSHTFEDGAVSAVLTTTIDGYCDIKTQSATIVLSNNYDRAATLMFQAEYDSGVEFGDGGAELTDGVYVAELNSGESVTLTFTSASSVNETTKYNISVGDFQLIPSEATCALAVEVHQASLDMGTVSGAGTYSVGAPVTVTATAIDGYGFTCWVDGNGNFVSAENEYTFPITEDTALYARFSDASPANFGVESARFEFLDDALEYAAFGPNKTVVVLEDCTVTGSYTIPSGVTLLVPFDDVNTLYTTAPGTVESYETPTCYRTLTLASGANIVVNGAISVSAKQSSARESGAPVGPSVGCPTGPYGELHMLSGSTITCNSGAKLYAWGFITGNGTIRMNSGSTAYEDFQVCDWRGGNGSRNMYSNSKDKAVFPFSQYYVQNVQVPMTLEDGAEEKVYVSISAGGTVTKRELSFIGTSALLQLGAGGIITKDYDESTDRLKVDVNGALDIGYVSLSFRVAPISLTVNSSDYVLPINGNMTVTAKSGSTINISNDTAFLPGAELIIEHGARSVVGAEKKTVVYDYDNWQNDFCSITGTAAEFVPAPYAVGRDSTTWNTAVSGVR